MEEEKKKREGVILGTRIYRPGKFLSWCGACVSVPSEGR